MEFETEGTLTTDKREVSIDETWGSQTEWEAYQSISNIDITDGVLTLSEYTIQPLHDFEDQDLSAYTFDGKDDPTNTFEVSQTEVYAGDYSLENTGSDDNMGLYSMPGDGLDFYPEADGEAFGFAMYTTGPQVWFRWMCQSDSYETDGYSIALNRGSGFEIGKWDAGDYTVEQDVTLPEPETDRWWHFTIVHESNGDISVTAVDLSDNTATGNITDADYTSGGIGWRYQASSSGQTYHDGAVQQ